MGGVEAVSERTLAHGGLCGVRMVKHLTAERDYRAVHALSSREILRFKCRRD